MKTVIWSRLSLFWRNQDRDQLEITWFVIRTKYSQSYFVMWHSYWVMFFTFQTVTHIFIFYSFKSSERCLLSIRVEEGICLSYWEAAWGIWIRAFDLTVSSLADWRGKRHGVGPDLLTLGNSRPLWGCFLICTGKRMSKRTSKVSCSFKSPWFWLFLATFLES